MKRTFIKMLPVVAAVLLATSCSKDGNDDSNVAIDPVETQNVATPTESSSSESKTIPFSITVGRDSESLSKASLQAGTSTTQVFESGDQLVLKNGETEVATLSLPTDYESSTTATFSGELTTEGLVSGTTEISVTLTNSSHGNTGTALTEVQEAISLAEAFQKYGYWTSSFTYEEGKQPTISLVQNTVFLRIKPYKDAGNKATVNGNEYTAQSDGTIYLAVASGTAIASNLFHGVKTVTNADGKVVKNIDRSGKASNDIGVNSLGGMFSVGNGKFVAFSKGNLQATTKDNCVTWTFDFAEQQYVYLGNGGANEKVNGNGTVSENGTVDLFGWVGASSPWTGAAMYGISNSETYNSVETYGNVSGEALKSDWGTLVGDGKTWRTLTKDEWKYLFNTRGGTEAIRYAKATVCGKAGVILLPDDWRTSTYSLNNTNTSGAAFTTNTIADASTWSTLEDAGAVFLPAAGYRVGTDVSVSVVGSYGNYWSSTANGKVYVFDLFFYSGEVNPVHDSRRYCGQSVRLVRDLAN